jgi:hypothetical protein
VTLASGPAAAVKLYESAGSFAVASRLLDQMLARFTRDELKGCKQVDSDENGNLAARQAWLRAVLEAPPVSTGGSSERSARRAAQSSRR